MVEFCIAFAAVLSGCWSALKGDVCKGSILAATEQPRGPPRQDDVEAALSQLAVMYWFLLGTSRVETVQPITPFLATVPDAGPAGDRHHFKPQFSSHSSSCQHHLEPGAPQRVHSDVNNETAWEPSLLVPCRSHAFLEHWQPPIPEGAPPVLIQEISFMLRAAWSWPCSSMLCKASPPCCL